MPASANTALRKRQQIAQANRVMFGWVVGASAIVAIAAVLSVTLFNKMLFNQKVIDAQAKTASVLQQNKEAVDPNSESNLFTEALVLNTNKLLLDKRVDKDTDKPIQVILDALPAERNSSSLGASLQNILLNVDGVTIETLTVGNGSEEEGSVDSINGTTINFSFTAKSSNINDLFTVLSKLEKSIRPIKVQSYDIQVSETDVSLTVKAQSYYQPAVSIDLGTKSIKPDTKVGN